MPCLNSSDRFFQFFCPTKGVRVDVLVTFDCKSYFDGFAVDGLRYFLFQQRAHFTEILGSQTGGGRFDGNRACFLRSAGFRPFFGYFFCWLFRCASCSRLLVDIPIPSAGLGLATDVLMKQLEQLPFQMVKDVPLKFMV